MRSHKLGNRQRTDTGSACVGAPGFEPGTSWSQTRRANQAALRPVPTIVTHRQDSPFTRPRLRRLASGPMEADVAYEWIIDALDTTWTSIDKLVRPLPA